jgi:pilus assembly protein CpaC
VKPVNANDIVLPTDGYKAPTDLERVFLGQMQSGKGEDRPKPRMAPSGAAPTLGALTTAPVAPEPDNKQQPQPAAALAPPPAPSKKSKGKGGAGAAPGFSFD